MKINRKRFNYLPKIEEDQQRLSDSHDPWYKQPRWRRLRKQFLNKHPLCIYCNGVVKTAEIVDHLRPRRLYPELEWEEKNFSPVCSECHRKKSGKESQIKERGTWEEKMIYYKKIHEKFLLSN